MLTQARGGAGFVAAGRTLYVIGGFNGNELGDMHVFDTETETWRQLELSGMEQQLPARSVAGVAAVSSGEHTFQGPNPDRLHLPTNWIVYQPCINLAAAGPFECGPAAVGARRRQRSGGVVRRLIVAPASMPGP